MLYIVSGYMRSGTSMMVDALSSGMRHKGLPVIWSKERDEAMNSKHGDADYKPNASYREIPLTEYSDPRFPLRYDNCLIKIMSWGLQQMRKVPHRIVFMIRNPLEVADSMERAFGNSPTLLIDGCKVSARDASTEWIHQYNQMMKSVVVQAETRIDCRSFTVVDYKDVLQNPIEIFNQIKLDGWDIDIPLASGVIDPKRKRARDGIPC